MSARGFLLSAVFMVGLLFIYATLPTSNPSPTLVPFSALITSPQTNVTFPARPAAFGPSLPSILPGDGSSTDDTGDSDATVPSNAFTGRLYVLESHGCISRTSDSSGEPVPDLRDKIALVMRGECSFYEKVLNLQSWGAAAVIVGDVEGARGLLTMSAKGDTHKIGIPSFFVSHSSYVQLGQLHTVSIIPAQPPSPVLDTLLFLLVSPLLSLSLIYALLIFHRRYKRMRDRAPKAFVENLPTRIWGTETNNANGREKLWGSAAECVICLEDYVPGQSRVMQLPCGHEFHSTCITPWLTLRKRTCPICKRDVTNANEQLPLLAPMPEAGDPDLEESRQQHLQQQQIAELQTGSSSSSTSRQNLIELNDEDEIDDLYDSSTSVRLENLTPSSERSSLGLDEPEAASSSSPCPSTLLLPANESASEAVPKDIPTQPTEVPDESSSSSPRSS
ncbi:hypothetical protein V1525DRAFT_423013 [Lipomyces kononenkoae]|uniref:Uncharacterized protein n=1 Tax=Lipomyces kononenkoae TaxID=34357 RepID=A0ACC3TBZ5_LIPKO